MATNIHNYFVIVFCCIFMKGGSFSIQSQQNERKMIMKTNEHDYYSELANWSFEDIDYITETLTNWIYEEKIKELANKESKILDLGTAAGEKVLKRFPECAEILGTDFSEEMIASANKNLLKSGRKNISFKVMDNLKMNTPDDYFDLVTLQNFKKGWIHINKRC